MQMLGIVMPSDPLRPMFCEFLQQQTEYKVVNFDQWTSFLRFSQEVAQLSSSPLPLLWLDRPCALVMRPSETRTAFC